MENFIRQDGVVVQIPADARDYVRFEPFDDGRISHYFIDWEGLYLDKIKKTPQHAARLIAEYEKRKNTYDNF